MKAGVQELLVISQDTSAYGVDLGYSRGFRQLVEGLAELGVWVRLHYVYPYPHVDEVIPWMAEGKILPYLDIPFQHGSPAVLKRMRRPAMRENNLERIRAWRAMCPEITLRSTFIVGFPGETEEEFQELLDFLDEAQLDRVGCFQYSPVEGAAANALPNPVPDEVKEERYHRFMIKQQAISAERLQKKVGKTMKVLVDSIEDGVMVARSSADAPEIDGVVRVEGADLNASVGEFVQVRIRGASAYDLFA